MEATLYAESNRLPFFADGPARFEGFRQRGLTLCGDVGTAVRTVTLLFTDLHDSTAMYERLGDLHAYALVRSHFTQLQDLIAASEGVLVKTIGDAVMAAFARPASALHAALRMVREVTGGGLRLKVGLHTGLCIAVKQDDRPDYFGQTVNIAARAQGEAHPGEVVCTRAVVEARGAAHVLSRVGGRPRAEAVRLKGVREPVTLFRVPLDAAEHAAAATS